MESCLCGWLCSLGIHGLKGIRRIHGLKETVLTHNEILMRSEKKKREARELAGTRPKSPKRRPKQQVVLTQILMLRVAWK